MKAKVLSSKKEIIKEYLIPFILELLILAGLIVCFSLFIDKGPLLQEAKMVGDEMSSPTRGRLIYGIISFVAFVVLAVLASKSAKKGKDTKAFWLGYTAGILLWQSIGEAAWHFSVGGINFTQLESITSLPMIIVVVMVLVYCWRNRSFDWGVIITFLSFMCNWLGHYMTIGIYPLFASFIDKSTWILVMSFIVGGISLILSIRYLLFKADTKKARMAASIFTYISLAFIVFGILER